MKGIFETALMLSTTVIAAGCLPAFPTGATSTEAAAQMDESAITASIANGAYRYSPQFAPLNRDAYGSTAATGVKINVWVTASQLTAYAKIDPGKAGTGVKLLPGGMIVREVLTADGSVAKLTLMVKGPPGYNSALGDYWFAVTEPDGTPLEENGAKLTGKLTQCFGCHIPRANDDYLFGVPAAARQPAPAMTVTPDMALQMMPGAPDLAWVPPPRPVPPSHVNVCGDFYCYRASESCASCPSDCGRCDDHGGDDD
jgi:hypothetical protein